MAPVNLEHRRTHNLLLLSKLLNQRELASPFTLVLDHLEQSSRPLISDCIRRAQKSGTKTIFIALETLRKPAGVDSFIPLWQYGTDDVPRQLNKALKCQANGRLLIIIDSLNLLYLRLSSNLPAWLSSCLTPGVSLVAVYHTDVPLKAAGLAAEAYQPSMFNLLRYLATAIIHVHSLKHMLSQKAARDRGIAEPAFGLEEGIEGVLVGMDAQGSDGLVMELEFRRKSGRCVKEWYFLPKESTEVSGLSRKPSSMSKVMGGERTIILEDHPGWTVTKNELQQESQEIDGAITFNLGLTERQRQVREGVVLPYFDAQKGGGLGGRILYDIGAEDDFDEEEDEI